MTVRKSNFQVFVFITLQKSMTESENYWSPASNPQTIPMKKKNRAARPKTKKRIKFPASKENLN